MWLLWEVSPYLILVHTLGGFAERSHLSEGAAADVFMYLNTQIPYIYVHLITVITKIHLILISMNSAAWVGQGFQEAPHGAGNQLF